MLLNIAEVLNALVDRDELLLQLQRPYILRINNVAVSQSLLVKYVLGFLTISGNGCMGFAWL
jgi:hypothetical protein